MCDCKPVDLCDIAKNSVLPSDHIGSIVEENHISDANTAIGDLLGVECADQLCAALEKAIEDYEAAQSPEDKSPLDYLEDKWKNIVTNRYFIRWYANRVAYSYFEGTSISKVTDAGLVQLSNDDEYQNDFKPATEDERKRLEISSKRKAEEARGLFKKTFWDKNKHNYDCAEKCDCGKCHKCLSCEDQYNSHYHSSSHKHGYDNNHCDDDEDYRTFVTI